MPLPSQNVAPGAHWMEHEEPEILAELAVVALLGFLDPAQVRLQLGLASQNAVP